MNCNSPGLAPRARPELDLIHLIDLIYLIDCGLVLGLVALGLAPGPDPRPRPELHLIDLIDWGPAGPQSIKSIKCNSTLG